MQQPKCQDDIHICLRISVLLLSQYLDFKCLLFSFKHNTQETSQSSTSVDENLWPIRQVQFSAPQKTCVSFENRYALLSSKNDSHCYLSVLLRFWPSHTGTWTGHQPPGCLSERKTQYFFTRKDLVQHLLQLISPSNTLQLLQTIHKHFSLATRGCQRVTVRFIGLCVSGLFLSILFDLSKTQKDLHKLEKCYCYLYLRAKKKKQCKSCIVINSAAFALWTTDNTVILY